MGVLKSSLKPWMMSWPKPPCPMNTVTVTRPIVVTVATLIPANMAGKGELYLQKLLQRRITHTLGRVCTVGGDRVEAGNGIPEQYEQRIADEGHLGGSNGEKPGNRGEK